MASGMSTTIYTLSVTDAYFPDTWGTYTLSQSTYVYWNTPVYGAITPNMSNPLIFSNTYNNSGSSFTATIYVMCDDECAFYLNGTLIGNNGAWPNGYEYSITIAPGENTFQFFCENYGSSLNPAGFAVNLYDNNNNLIMLTDDTCSGGSNCSGWTCVIGGFFTKNQPLLTFYQIGGPQSNSGYSTNIGDIQIGFKSGTNTVNSNYQVSGSDLSTLDAPCIPIINYLSSTTTTITISWYYFGLCNSYTIYYGTSSPPTTTHTISSGNFWEASNTSTNSTGQKYCNFYSGIPNNPIFQTGYNTYTLTGLSSGTLYDLYVSCGFNTIDSTSSSTNQLSSSTGSSTSATTSYSTGLTPFTSTSGILTNTNGTITLATNFSIPSSYNYFNFYVFGGGGDSTENSGNAAGGGSGGFISALSIPYTNSGNTISSIRYIVGSGGENEDYSYVEIYYTSSIYITITAYSGGWVTSASPTTAGYGGGTTYTNTTSFYSNNNITGHSGAQGGNSSPSSGSSSGYTSSGSGGTASGPAYNYYSATFSFTATDGNTYSNTSLGGGSNQTVSGYGSGGAATPANYNNNAPAYRYGSQGCIYYALS